VAVDHARTTELLIAIVNEVLGLSWQWLQWADGSWGSGGGWIGVRSDQFAILYVGGETSGYTSEPCLVPQGSWGAALVVFDVCVACWVGEPLTLVEALAVVWVR